MIRTQRYKLIYYYGDPPQLFDVLDDPLEERDLAASSRHQAIREALTSRLLADWNPMMIDARMKAREQDKGLIGAWARAANPASNYVWQMQSKDNYLGLSGEFP
jgi:choline-sulfatase